MLQNVVQAIDDHDEPSFTATISDYHKITPFDKLKSSLLAKAKTVVFEMPQNVNAKAVGNADDDAL